MTNTIVNFEHIAPGKLIDFLSHTCKNGLYKVDEFSIEYGKVPYLSGECMGEKAYYMLTAVVIYREEIVQVLLHASLINRLDSKAF
ncbi:hypothetical protein [Methanosarcina sp. 2.H.A.1B.4]|uniref:hypothetical protein n=1 Tax=Methanosarcina sp. 2.H.A.1B.4 TaxID=1483600 RepID=UPI000621CB98|nr:hypothetical protein [Methanosarcina sp. 2.H.A.1B.4]KKG12200.1 hypothetical protein EO92_05745 [Methanosarcina sp. 2.H.A.1B.4]